MQLRFDLFFFGLDFSLFLLSFLFTSNCFVTYNMFYYIRVFLEEGAVYGLGHPSVEYLGNRVGDFHLYDSSNGRILLLIDHPVVIFFAYGSVLFGHAASE